MTWRGTTSTQDRIFGALVYLMPILDVLGFGLFLASLFPPLLLLFVALSPLLAVYNFTLGGFPLVQMGLFFGLFLLVVNNRDVAHFLRFHTLQAILISILAFLIRLVLDILNISSGLSDPFLRNTTPDLMTWITGGIESIIFIAVLAAGIFAIVQSLRGQYADLPVISEAAQNQLRY
ncbi:Tic20 family protein [Spirulina sp. CCNP1310]|uniref:Tic20 family protein n=1 Tax=Spirulina sp. CCNP1310 TaxID=3110249 RepID=UPI002B21C836|nr:Tic20 family protein [Spirulina sp. CCNP1310]MEA5418353.1 Tic20 family protein [Spirulina sp. CCNP1310]